MNSDNPNRSALKGSVEREQKYSIQQRQFRHGTRVLRWLNHRQQSILWVMVVTILIMLVVGGVVYGQQVDWTGFGATTYPAAPAGQMYQPAKTLWDWLQLLVIPVVIAVGGFLFSRSERRTQELRDEQRVVVERAASADEQRESALQQYIDRMTVLLLDRGLQPHSTEYDLGASSLLAEHQARDRQVRGIARALTTSTFAQLDSDRRAAMIRFLADADLIAPQAHILVLKNADLHAAHLSGVHLPNNNLERVNLVDAHLSGSNLGGTNFSSAQLQRAKIGGVQLQGSNLDYADLSQAFALGAHFEEANLTHTTCQHADLSNANFTGAQCLGTNFRGARLHAAMFVKTQLSYADFRGADLREAHFSGAVLDNAIFVDSNITWEQINQAASTIQVQLPKSLSIAL